MKHQHLKYDIQKGIKRIKTKTTIAVTALGLMLGGGAGLSLATFGTAHAAIPNCTVGVGKDYLTIQAAVNEPACTTITVDPGIYAEHVTVNRAVVLNGAYAGTAGNSGSRVAESIVSGSDTDAAFAITANNVTIDGFTVENGSNGGFDAGIWSQTGTQNSTIKNNIITSNAFGIWAQCGGTCLIQDNLFNGNNKPGTGAGSASVSADSTTGLTINHNEFKNDTVGNPILLQATAAGAHKTVVVTNNNFHNNTNASVIYAVGITGGTITGNTILPASDVTGISFSGADTNITVKKNIITGGARGVRVENVYGADSSITVNRNNVSSDSGYGVGNTDAAITSLDATCNWWGSASGPGSVGPGTGSPVTTNVNFASWLTSSNLNSACNGGPLQPPPTDKDQCRHNGWKKFNNPSFKNQGQCIDWVKATASGDLRMSGPSQKIKFNVANTNKHEGDSDKADHDKRKKKNNTVEYWNYDNPGGVLHYTANVTCAFVNPQTNEARFMFQIPTGHPGLSGLYVVAYVKDIEQKHKPDLYGHAATAVLATATQWCQTGIGFSPQMYVVTKGEVEVK